MNAYCSVRSLTFAIRHKLDRSVCVSGFAPKQSTMLLIAFSRARSRGGLTLFSLLVFRTSASATRWMWLFESGCNITCLANDLNLIIRPLGMRYTWPPSEMVGRPRISASCSIYGIRREMRYTSKLRSDTLFSSPSWGKTSRFLLPTLWPCHQRERQFSSGITNVLKPGGVEPAWSTFRSILTYPACASAEISCKIWLSKPVPSNSRNSKSHC